MGFMAPGGGTGPKTLGFAGGWIRGFDEPPVTFLVEPKFVVFLMPLLKAEPSDAVALILISFRVGSSVSTKIFSTSLRVPALGFLASSTVSLYSLPGMTVVRSVLKCSPWVRTPRILKLWA